MNERSGAPRRAERLMRSRRATKVAGVIAMATALSVLFAGMALSAQRIVTIRDNDSFDPAVRRAVRGDVVIWRNPTGDTHNVTAYGSNWSFRSGNFDSGSVRKRFRNVGRYRYRCTLHSDLDAGVCEGMCGVVRVRRPG
jgi:plastocyanin